MTLIDEQGYPTEEALTAIRQWHSSDPHGLMRFIKTIWWPIGSPYGWEEVGETIFNGANAIRYSVSTGGWSGNESIIGALMGNHVWWLMNWLSSRRGGHYEFQIKTNERK